MAPIKFSSSFPQADDQYFYNRPRLDALFDEAFRRPVVVVSAGAGYGKTKSVYAYLKKNNYTIYWVACTPLDNYPLHFWETLVQALEHGSKKIKKEMQWIGFPDTAEKMDFFLRALRKAFGGGPPAAIVLDDIQFLADEAILQVLNCLLHAPPQGVHMVASTRNATHFDVLGLYEKGRLGIVLERQLAFAPEETRGYMEQTGLQLSGERLEHIQTVTGGWPVAVHLIAQSQTHENIPYDEAASLTLSLLYELIEQEVFSVFPGWMQKKYIKLSLLESIPQQLLQTLVQDMAEELVQSFLENAFVQFDRFSGEFQFHTMFAEFLKSKQYQLAAEEKTALYQTAAGWYEENGYMLKAVTCYKQAGNHSDLWRLIAARGVDSYSEEAAAFQLDIIESFPQDFISARPLITIFHASLLNVLRKADVACNELLALEMRLGSLQPDGDNARLWGELYLALAHAHLLMGSYAYAEYYKKAAPLLPEGSGVIGRGQMYVSTNTAFFLFGAESGQLEKSLGILMDVMPLASQMMHGCGHGMELLAMAEASYYRLHADKAEEYAYRAIHKASEKQQYDIICGSYFLLARVYMYKGSVNKLEECLERLKEYAQADTSMDCAVFAEIVESWLCCKMNHTEKVAPWIMEDAFAGKKKAPARAGREQLIKAGCLLLKHEYFQLLGFLDYLEKLFLSQKQFFSYLGTLIIKAICLYRSDNLREAHRVFTAAYKLAAPNQLVVHFVEAGKDMRSLINSVQRGENGEIPDWWLEMVQKKASIYAKRQNYVRNAYYKRIHPLQDDASLSKRELDVLQCLAQGLTRTEISEMLDISINTVKSIIKSLYDKLQAVNRAEAIHIASAKGII